MLSLACFIIGLFIGFIGGVFYYAKKVNKHIKTEEISRASINALVNGNEPHGDIIHVNKTAIAIKEATGNISIDDVLEEENV